MISTMCSTVAYWETWLPNILFPEPDNLTIEKSNRGNTVIVLVDVVSILPRGCCLGYQGPVGVIVGHTFFTYVLLAPKTIPSPSKSGWLEWIGSTNKLSN